MKARKTEEAEAPIKPRPDYVMVRLSPAGVEFVGQDGSLTFSNRHMHYTFKPGEAREVVLRYEWLQVLRHQRVNGESLLELVAAGDLVAAEQVEQAGVEEGDPNGSV